MYRMLLETPNEDELEFGRYLIIQRLTSLSRKIR